MNSLLRLTNRYFQSYLLKNAKVVNADNSVVADVLLEGGKVAAV